MIEKIGFWYTRIFRINICIKVGIFNIRKEILTPKSHIVCLSSYSHQQSNKKKLFDLSENCVCHDADSGDNDGYTTTAVVCGFILFVYII